MTCALLSRDSQLSADCAACTFGTAVCLGVITYGYYVCMFGVLEGYMFSVKFKNL
jgi:hypothetical protein